jgi:hypothetical protein
MLRWRGREGRYREQVANACDDFVDLTPASEAPAQQVEDNWSALKAGQDIPLIGERSYGYCQEDDGCPREC